ncbi:hypothetical protein [Thalassospira sp. HJ]|uniref:hypothetical protein n=1 Tax=Thalassospira sp. HJ TaxID=1616823 RepID=UPI000AD8F22E|nr:hypothetical protein [Thalassospira sp. HJ]
MLERDGRYFLGVFDLACGFDLYRHQAVAEGEPPRRHWGNLEALDGLEVSVWGDGVLANDIPVAGGTITVPDHIGAVSEIEVGLPFTHEIYALPPAASDGSRPHGGNAVRLVSVTLRLQETGQLRVDTGRGLRDVALPVSALPDEKDALYSGDITLRALGWRRGSGGTVKSGLWRIAGALPRPFLLLGAASEMGVND